MGVGAVVTYFKQRAAADDDGAEGREAAGVKTAAEDALQGLEEAAVPVLRLPAMPPCPLGVQLLGRRRGGVLPAGTAVLQPGEELE